jgi:hypothetical protein
MDDLVNRSLIVLDGTSYSFRTRAPKPIERMSIEIVVNDGAPTVVESLGFCFLSFGVFDGALHWWSTQSLFRVERSGALKELFSMDDDVIHAVFRTRDAWIIVAETSVQLHDGTNLLQRLPLQDITLTAYSDAHGVLTVNDFQDNCFRVHVEHGRLELQLIRRGGSTRKK